jgi:FkbM family methyltransferase
MGILKKVYLTLREQGRYPLNKKSSIRAAIDFSVAQVAARLVPGEVCVEFPNQTRLLVPPHMKGAAHFIYPGLCEFEDMGFVLHFLRPTDLFVDVGANIGAFTVLASGSIGSRVVSFEPATATFTSLLSNIRLNGISDRVTAHNMAVGRADGVLQFSEGLGTENSVQMGGEAKNSKTVKVGALNQLLAHAEPALIKIDVEGFETEVIAGAADVLKNDSLQAIVIERNNSGSQYGFNEQQLHEKIMSFGFIPHNYSPLSRTLRQLLKHSMGNIIYIKNVEKAQARLSQAPPFKYKGFSV